jgi:DNA polymerase-3 subunit delta
VVKVQRPGVEALVEEDLAILRDLARLAAGRTAWGQIYDLPAMVEEFASKGKKAERSVANLLVRRAGTDTSVLTTEVEKLVSYAGECDRVTVEDVNAVTTETPEEKVFALVDAVATKNEAQALEHLSEVFSSGGRPEAEAPRVLALLARQFRLLWQFMYLKDLGCSPLAVHQIPEDVLDSLPSEPSIIDVAKRQSWLIDKLGKQARNFERRDLERGFMLIMATDAMLKGIEGEIDDPRTAMELLVLGLCRRKALK